MFGAMTRRIFFLFFHGGAALGPPLNNDVPGVWAIPDALWTKGKAVKLTEAKIGENLRCLSNELI
ncbi:MAG: hypothetical protein OXQ29_14880 [Rhodospirillaceae bacterium]|nr:hypothetical protein [Rhodospirillaceae bacterium]